MSEIRVDTISEKTSANGVAVDGVTLKDGKVTANAGVVVDELTIDADTITATDDFIIDAVGDITLDADGDNIRLNYGGTQIGQFKHASSNLEIHTTVNNEDMIFKGIDNNSEITALTLDMSEAGQAIFNQGIVAAGSTAGGYGLKLNTASGDNVQLTVLDTGSGGAANATLNTSDGSLILSTAGTERMRITSGGLAIGGTGAANTLDDYEEGTWDPAATFNDDGATGHGGKYTKIGNVVTATFNITFGSTSFGAVISVSGLPFSATTQSGLAIGGAMIKGYYDGSSTNLSGYVGDNSSQIDLRENQVHLTHNSDKILGKNLRGTVVYHVN